MNALIAHRGPDAENVWFDAEAGIALAHRRAGDRRSFGSGQAQAVAFPPMGVSSSPSMAKSTIMPTSGASWTMPASARVARPVRHRSSPRGDHRVGRRRNGRAPQGDVRLCPVGPPRAYPHACSRPDGRKAPLFRVAGPGSSRALLSAPTWQRCDGIQRSRGSLTGRRSRSWSAISTFPSRGQFIQGISKLPAGTIHTIDPATERSQTIEFWNTIEEAAAAKRAVWRNRGRRHRRLGPRAERAVGGQMMADVPLGAFLSGGINSSTIVALMQRLSTRPVKTFTIGFDSSDTTKLFMQGRSPRTSARTTRTHPAAAGRHCDHSCLARNIQRALRRSLANPDVPRQSTGSRAGYRSLSGDAGDEPGGYNRHVYAHCRWPKIERLPQMLRHVSSRPRCCPCRPRLGTAPRGFSGDNRTASRATRCTRQVKRWARPMTRTCTTVSLR